METLVTESVIFALLSESQRGPRLYGVFPGGRLEEYIEARPLRTQELSDPVFSARIAEKMAQIHLMDVPISKQPKWLWQTIQRSITDISRYINDTPNFKLFCNAQTSCSTNFFRSYLTKVNSPVVFCHNDLQEGNILFRESEGCAKSDKVVVIDYEYCSYNYRGFDFANHFCEWMYDYTNEEPPYFWEKADNLATKEQQDYFFIQYLNSLKSSKDYKYRKHDEVSNLMEETEAFMLASHFFWALWSVVNSSASEIMFDYWVLIFIIFNAVGFEKMNEEYIFCFTLFSGLWGGSI
ncbi:hypothetical protein AAG570_006581 [Ranatra chinensis]|uniref:Choline kinase alpha n=1 Tax=Ranatra chinensis TaxID=642074 RepID=A0ABD0YUF2_9HEMI